jgi:hypothetical protein
MTSLTVTPSTGFCADPRDFLCPGWREREQAHKQEIREAFPEVFGEWSDGKLEFCSIEYMRFRRDLWVDHRSLRKHPNEIVCDVLLGEKAIRREWLRIANWVR